MSKIKINSNPYKKLISYFRWDQFSQDWFPINYESNPNSVLISEDMVTNFFPFKANMIVDVLIDEYSDGSLSIEFEGTDDEYEILKAICESKDYLEKVTLVKSAQTLENARDILPDIVSVFNEIRPIVERSISQKEIVEDEFNKFTDATKDQVPVCIVGNYSAGKSSFINALIGHEILPSADKPVTARVFKISPSRKEKEGFVSFQYSGIDVRILFNGNDQHVESELTNHPLIDRIRELIDPLDTVDLFRSINTVLKAINTFEEKDLDLNISNLIEIEVPFNSSMFGDSNIDYVIFDTPGSNTATNYRHVEVLKQAMENMSNGLPLFVAEYDTLDSMDNEKLYNDINSLEELDSRFTMVVVNKSDGANLPIGGFTPEEEDEILNLSIPRNLYSGGIYFVSSVLGLGSKTDGDFYDDHYGEVFDDISPRFSNPNHKRYRRLYDYNIMPEQLKKDSIAESAEYENLLLANSGLYCIEQEINRFAEVYSAYNKCIQADLFLGKVLDITFADLEEKRTDRVKNRIRRSNLLDKEKAQSIDELEKLSDELKSRYIKEYNNFLQGVVCAMTHKFTTDEFKQVEEELKLTYEGKNEVNIESFAENKKASVDDLIDSIKFTSSMKQIKDAFKKWRTESSRFSNAEETVKLRARKKLFEQLREKMQISNDAVHKELNECSVHYWIEKTEAIRKSMVDLVSKSEGINKEIEDKLTDMILEYKTINLHEPNIASLDKAKFENKLMAIIFSDPLNLNRGKVIKTYNNEIEIMQITHLNNVFNTYADSFIAWIHELTKTLVDNIIEINPELAERNEDINNDTRIIEELEKTKIRLEDYASQIHKMIQWQTE